MSCFGKISRIYLLLCVWLLTMPAPIWALQVHSTSTGGLWSQISTWAGGVVPGEFDSVFVDSQVNLDTNATVYCLEISGEGVLQNNVSGSYILTVTGDCTNHGTIQNNGLQLVLYISGDVLQNGVWTNLHTLLSGYSDQHLWINQPFGGQYLTKYNTSGNLIVHTRFELKNTAFDMNNDTIYFLEGDSFRLDGGSLDQARIIKNPAFDSGNFTFEMLNNSVFQKTAITADTIRLEGIVQFQSAPVTFNGQVVVTGTLRNFSTGSYTANINGSISNFGNVTKNIFSLNLNVSEDWINNGNWNTSLINLTGDDDQYLQFHQPVKSIQIVNAKPSGTIISTGNMSLNATNFNLDSDSLLFIQGYRLQLTNSSIRHGSLIFSGDVPAELELANNSSFEDIVFYSDTILLKGIVQLKDEEVRFNAVVFNTGILQNVTGQDGSAIFMQGFTNAGTIADNAAGEFKMLLNGNVNQEGIWQNTQTIFTGNDKKEIGFSREFHGKKLMVESGPDTIEAQTDLIFFGTDINLDSTILMMPGFSKFYLKNGSLQNCIFSSQKIEFAMPGSGICSDVSFPDTDLFGNNYLRDHIVFTGDLTNRGVIRNCPGNPVNLSVAGNFTNHGMVNDSLGEMVISVGGNVYNNGDLLHSSLAIIGTEDQEIQLQNGRIIASQLKLIVVGTEPFEWFKNSVSLDGIPGYSGVSNDTLLFPEPSGTDAAGVYRCMTGTGWSRQIIIDTLCNIHHLDLKVFLEGPFNGEEMNTTINEDGNLPLDQPFANTPWFYPGSETVQAIPNEDVVDWILLELKEGPDAAMADKTTIFERQVVFVLKDGRVVSLDGYSKPLFARTVSDSIYIDIIHRNHLDMMSAFALRQNGEAFTWDFTDGISKAYGNSQNGVNGISVMISGDANADSKVSESDIDQEWRSFAGLRSEYQIRDLNLDGQINNKDKNDCWLSGFNKMVVYPK